MTIEEKIAKLEHDITIDVNMAEEISWAQYISYIKLNVEELSLLKKAKKIRDKNKEIEKI